MYGASPSVLGDMLKCSRTQHAMGRHIGLPLQVFPHAQADTWADTSVCPYGIRPWQCRGAPACAPRQRAGTHRGMRFFIRPAVSDRRSEPLAAGKRFRCAKRAFHRSG